MNISAIQENLKSNAIDGLIVTRNNMFLGQDVLDTENRIKQMCNFSGSAGNMLIMQDKVFLFVDGRYDIQAKNQVDTNIIEVICTKETLATWMDKNLESGLKIAYNPWCHSISEVDYWSRNLKKINFIEDTTGLDKIISCVDADIFEHDIEFCGIDRDEKISIFTKFMADNKLDAYLITSCDCLSWLLNLRSDAIPNTPIIRAYGLIDKNGELSLFTNNFNILDEELEKFKSQTVGVTYNQTPKKVFSILKKHNIWVENINNPIQNWKSIKNDIELSNIKKAHIKDGISLAKFLFWLSKNWKGKTELDIVEEILKLRKQNKDFYSNSFDTIAGFGSNGAIVHYKPSIETNKKLQEKNLLLLDSGAQYLDGTTDITRTIAIGEPSQEMIDNFTTVLKSHIALADLIFPENTSGQLIDGICRHKLWQKGLDYSHGTGHGVGFFAGVHEGPQSISSKNSSPLKENMVLSIEPGYYKEDNYGIRIENLYYITKASYPNMLKFEVLSLAPIDKKLINKYLLNNEEIKWINDYHAKVYAILHNKLDSDCSNWLKDACSPL